MIITIDGPTASGKSSIAQLLAQSLHMNYLNSGMLYRVLAYLLLEKKYVLSEEMPQLTSDTLQTIAAENPFQYYYNSVSGQASIIYKEHDITALLKTKKIDHAASLLALNQSVRDYLLAYQRSYAIDNDVVVEGRDCGSIVFPAADVKFFLTAAVGKRASRWQNDQKKQGIDISFDDAIIQVQDRDTRDSARTIAPLIVPLGAIVLDNSALNKQQTVERMLEYIRNIK